MTWPKGLLVALATVWLAGCAAGQGQLTANGGTPSDTNLEQLAQKMERKGDYGAAAQFYSQSVQGTSDPSGAQLSKLAQTLYKAGRYEQAEAAYKRARERAPKNPDVHYGLGKARIALDRPQAALDSFDAALRNTQNGTTRAYLGKGVALDLLGRHKKAQRVYQRGMQDAADDLRLLNNYGLSLALDGQYDTAIQVLSTLAEDPQAGEKVRQNLALAHGLNGDLQRASEIGRYDLSQAAVQRNRQYYQAAKRALANGAQPQQTESSSPTASTPANDRTSSTSDGSAAQQGYWAQLGAFEEKSAAQRSRRRLNERYPDLLQDRQLSVKPFNSSEKGTLYRVRSGPFDTAQPARSLCETLLAEGEACVVVDQTWQS